MPAWQLILLLWVGVWALQSIGVWYQTRRYAGQLKELQHQYDSGYIGTGYGPRRLSRGAIVMIVATTDLKVRQFLLMRGATVFASFKPQEEFVGLSLSDVLEKLSAEPKKSSLKEAAEKAVAQIMRVKQDREQLQKGGSELAHA
jgi:glucitol operon activator protein